VACQAQLVNIIAPIRTAAGGPAWRQTIFHPFALTSRLARGAVLRVEPTGPRIETTKYGDVPALDATATYDEERGDTVLLAVNRGQQQPLLLEADIRALAARHGDLSVAEHWLLAGDDPYLTNTRTEPDRVVPRQGTGAEVRDGCLRVELPPVSWSAVRLEPVTRGKA
jgi:alpha-N-arabinofuranosidase